MGTPDTRTPVPAAIGLPCHTPIFLAKAVMNGVVGEQDLARGVAPVPGQREGPPQGSSDTGQT